ncbi:MAG: SH3 domain-containing protein [Candidatus Omnitrophica bacterium]|nr:SH3 domain-containing protein [Candidatus Omnitrophota bacterium]MBU2044477.1 SH3 domain-containing protein [Candidatus Omnitrophota bacterium]MBU2250907.1 SH3 domain-containing protein [Candidatus Omnitrophota bacterium]MBU2474107.1 SH3 domain-containing protein [Candidatus Omnitrophota bacterium]
MRIGFILLVSVFFSGLLICAPVTYEVAKDQINARVDSTVLSESMGLLSEGQEVKVLDEKFDWYKVILPETFSGYISKNFVKETGNNQLVVTGDSVNLRFRPDLTSPVIGKVNQGDILDFIESSGDWIKVAGYPHITGWVHKTALSQNNFSPELTVLLDQIFPQLSQQDIKNKVSLHKQLIDQGGVIIPLLEAKLADPDINGVYSLIDILSQIAIKQTESGDWGLARHFLEKAKKSTPQAASAYLDVLQNVLKPEGKKTAYLYLNQKGMLSAENIKVALDQFKTRLDSI